MTEIPIEPVPETAEEWQNLVTRAFAVAEHDHPVWLASKMRPLSRVIAAWSEIANSERALHKLNTIRARALRDARFVELNYPAAVIRHERAVTELAAAGSEALATLADVEEEK